MEPMYPQKEPKDSSIWTNIQSKNGINPPRPYVIGTNYSTLDIISSVRRTRENKISIINSNRLPYGVEHLDNGYGTLNTRLGTNLGKKI